eukprot:1192330-Prorocentrum_minimum.AAC.1
MELRWLYQYVALETLIAVDAMNKESIAANPKNINATHKAAPIYESLYEKLVRSPSPFPPFPRIPPFPTLLLLPTIPPSLGDRPP